MSILAPESIDFVHAEWLGLAIAKNDFGYHSGIVYFSDEQARLLHLAFHHNLIDEVLDCQSPFRWASVGLDEDNKIVLAGLVARIANINPTLPYAFNSDGVCFDTNGEFFPAPVGKGLTCSTFVMAVFATYGHVILDTDSWIDRPEDEAWREAIISLLQRHATPEHVQAVRADKNAPRYRPDEVVGSATCPDWPVSLPLAELLAEQVRSDLG